MTESFFALTQAAKRNDWISRLTRYAFGGNGAAREAIARMASANADVRLRMQHDLLRSVLQHAELTPYGRGRPADLGAWPVLDKAQLRQDPLRFVVRRCWPRVPAATSGTTGEPMRLWRGLGSITAEQAFLDHLIRPLDLSFRDARVAVLRSNSPRLLESGRMPIAERVGRRRLWLSLPQLSPSSLDDYLATLRAFAPDILWVYPVAGDMLAGLCLDRGVTLPVKVVLSSSEMLGDDAMRRMQAAFRAPVIDYYGQAERLCMAVRRHAGCTYFEPAYGHVELVPTRFEGAAPGMGYARIVATGFWNDAMPLVRYDTGDIIEHDPALSESELRLVALGILPFVRVIGREPGYLLAPGGGRVLGMVGMLGYGDGIRQAQYVQQEDLSVDIRVIPDDGFDETRRNALIARARQKLPKDVALRVSVVDRLETNASGKTPFVIRRCRDDAAQTKPAADWDRR
jgi:phenylacetate-CoA ligase